MIPCALWGAYQKKSGLVVIRQAWDKQQHGPIVYTANRQEQQPDEKPNRA